MFTKSIRWILIVVLFTASTLLILLPMSVFAQGGSISYGQTIRGSIQTKGSVDIWSFNGKQGDVVTVTMQVRDDPNYPSIMIPILVLKDASGDIVATDSYDPEIPAAFIANVRLPTNGQYTIEASAKNPGNYDLSVWLARTEQTSSGNCSGAFGFHTGMIVKVTPGDPNQLKDGPSRSANIIMLLPAGSTMTIIGGPICTDDGYVRWQVNYQGVIGWTVEGKGGEAYLVPVGVTPSQPEQYTFTSYEECKPDLRPLPDGRKRNWFDLLSNGWSNSKSVICTRNGEISYAISAFGGAGNLEQEGSMVAYVTMSYTPQTTGTMTIESDVEVNGTGSVGSGSSFAVKDAVEFISNKGSFLFNAVVGALSPETLATIKDLVDKGINASQLSTGSLNTRVFMTATTDQPYTMYDGLDGPNQTAFPLGPFTSSVTYKGKMAHLTLTVPVVAGQKVDIRVGLETVVQAHGWSLVVWNLRRQSSYVKAISLKANS